MSLNKTGVLKIINGRVLTDKVEHDKNLYVKDGKIIAITGETLDYDEVFDAKGGYISPGFIDLHLHGGDGVWFAGNGTEAIIAGSHMHLRHGTTTMTPSTSSAAHEVLLSTIESVRELMDYDGNDIPHIVGVHLEGPYFSPIQCGAQTKTYITAPIKKDYEDIIERGKGIVKRWSFAPELEGSVEFCDTLVKNGIIPSIGHTNCVYEDVLRVYDKGCKMMTHFYSGMSMLTRRDGFRILGAVESGYLLDDMTVEVIADGRHLPPELLKLIYKVKGAEHICLVTDAIRVAGMEGLSGIVPSGKHDEQILIEDGVAKMLDKKNFAGSIATTDRLVRTMHKSVGIDIINSVKMVTETPAKIMGLFNKGKLKEGYDADFVIFNDNVEVSDVFLMGKHI